MLNAHVNKNWIWRWKLNVYICTPHQFGGLCEQIGSPDSLKRTRPQNRPPVCKSRKKTCKLWSFYSCFLTYFDYVWVTGKDTPFYMKRRVLPLQNIEWNHHKNQRESFLKQPYMNLELRKVQLQRNNEYRVATNYFFHHQCQKIVKLTHPNFLEPEVKLKKKIHLSAWKYFIYTEQWMVASPHIWEAGISDWLSNL